MAFLAICMASVAALVSFVFLGVIRWVVAFHFDYDKPELFMPIVGSVVSFVVLLVTFMLKYPFLL